MLITSKQDRQVLRTGLGNSYKEAAEEKHKPEAMLHSRISAVCNEVRASSFLERDSAVPVTQTLNRERLDLDNRHCVSYPRPTIEIGSDEIPK